MKVAKTDTLKAEFRIWCEKCNIRVAPNEERTVVRGKDLSSDLRLKGHHSSSRILRGPRLEVNGYC
jgi:hypothetical protein